VPFIRIERKKSGSYIRLLESYRNEEGKSTNRILYSLGKLEDYTPEQLRRIGIKLYELGGGEIKALLQGEIKELSRCNYGYFQVIKKGLQHFGLERLIQRISRKHKLEFNLLDSLVLMMVERIHDPSSKRSNYLNQEDYLGLEAVSLHHLYRALDRLAENSLIIQKEIFQTGRDLFNQKLDLVFYDVTTLYFESEVVKEGSLRQKGFGKDGKLGKTQVLFCMLIDQDKNPIGYRLFKGNTYEGHTFEKALEDLKQQYQIDKVIVVADRGMLSEKNLNHIESHGYEFILGERLKSLPREIKETMIDKTAFRQEWIYKDNQDKEIKIQYQALEYGNRTILCTYSEKRARKDKSERDQKIEKAKRILLQPSQLKKKAQHYFLKSIGKEKYILDEDKIKESEKYDGFLAISTNNATLKHTQILDQYKQLYKIEHTFRTFKNHLEVRPMFHWTDKRIEGHICLCYITYAILNFVLKKINTEIIQISEMDLRRQLDKMQISLVQHNDELIYIRSTQQKNEAQIQQKLALKELPPFLPQSDIKKYL